jgi:hypothetical protein
MQRRQDTTAQGCRLATSVGGGLTGRGADLIIDDPLKPEEASSQAQRQTANEWFDHTLYSRLNDKLTGAIVLIMHRLHEDDLVGHATSRRPSAARSWRHQARQRPQALDQFGSVHLAIPIRYQRRFVQPDPLARRLQIGR